MPASATGTVADERTERKRELAEASRVALATAIEDYVGAALASSTRGWRPASRALDWRIRYAAHEGLDQRGASWTTATSSRRASR